MAAESADSHGWREGGIPLISDRRLQVDCLHFPRAFRPRHYRWDLDRGFRLEVLGPGLFWLALLESDALDLPMRPGAQGREQDFLLAVEPPGWPEWPSEHVGTQTVCAILANFGPQPTIDVPRKYPNLVIRVLQSLAEGTRWTGNRFFTPEQLLQQWGRVGRRVQRRSRWRPWLPW